MGMIKGKRVLHFIFSVFAGMFFMQNVSAYYLPSVRYGVESVINSWINFSEPILQVLFGGYGWSGNYLFETLLLFIILMCIVYLALGRVPLFEGDGKKVIRWIIAIIVPLLGLRFMDYQWLNAILIQYRLLAVIIGAVLPFIIYFYFIYNVTEDYDILRKLGWGFFIAVYIGLWAGTASEANSTIYFWTMVAALICIIFDGTIQRRFRALQQIKQNRRFINNEATRINDEIRRLNESLRNNTAFDPKATKDQIKELQKHIRWMGRQ